MSAAAGPGAGDVTYTYSTTLSQPLEHADGALENAITLTGVTVQVTDNDGDTLPVSFNVTIVDDVPQAARIDGSVAVDTEGTPLLITTALTSDLSGRRCAGDAGGGGGGDGGRGDGRSIRRRHLHLIRLTAGYAGAAVRSTTRSPTRTATPRPRR